MAFIRGTGDADQLDGTDATDFILALAGNDIVSAGGGNDFVGAGDGDDDVDGGPGNDLLFGGRGNDNVDGGPDNDVVIDSGPLAPLLLVASFLTALVPALAPHLAPHLAPFDDTDTLSGGDGNDFILSTIGNDRVIGGPGRDFLFGGPGDQVFQFDSPAEGADIIPRFTPGGDQIQVDAAGFDGGLTPGPLPEDRFVSGSDPDPAQPGVGTFLYDTDNGQLDWDADGAGGNDPVTVAFLIEKPPLAASDFIVA
jgi:Ca2+-binding RTX toxin-like protein